MNSLLTNDSPDPNGEEETTSTPTSAHSQKSQKSSTTTTTTVSLLANQHKIPLQKLNYDIDSWSSHSATYHPSNIMVNKPQEQSSRWSSGSNNQHQFITIKLEKMAIIHSITFGKYYKVHVCNLKEFKVFGGVAPDSMVELLHSGLRNDHEPETFPLKYRAGNVTLPCLYIKIVPLMAWGANFNFSIWYVELRGISEPTIVQEAWRGYVEYRENEAIRLCLKHFRQRNFVECFAALQKQTGLQLEDPVLTELHRCVVIDGNLQRAEQIMEESLDRGLFAEYMANCSYKPLWKRVHPDNSPGDTPCMRGGHQMCIDVQTGRIYLLGGWDGGKDIADFWAYDVAQNHWILLSPDTRQEGGPGPRSCHKICFDPSMRQIYVLGRYVDQESRANSNLESDFYRYDVERGIWSKVSGNTAAEGGPELIYDHQMCVDPAAHVMYVFGGRTVNPDSNNHTYSGLYAYYILTNRWKRIRSEASTPDGTVQLKSRIGHSMLFNAKERQLYIFAGQRHKDYLSDFYIYDIDTDTVHELSRDYSKQGGPDAGFTQRATLDVDEGEFYVLSGLMKEKNTSQETVKNSFWVYNIAKEKWSRVYLNENTDAQYWTRMASIEPCPRFAHQLVYDPRHKVQYLFGGNPGDNGNQARLDDLWELRLVRPTKTDVVRKGLFSIRKQMFHELCKHEDSIVALRFLQVQLGSVVDHDDPIESAEFRGLTTRLFNKGIGSTTNTFQDRTELYEHLLQFFPEGMKQPKANLVDMVQMG